MDLKGDSARRSTKLSMDKKEAQGVFALQQTKRPSLQIPPVGTVIDDTQMMLFKEKYLHYCKMRGLFLQSFLFFI